jgi:putative ABC transport system substrate-binding protein
MRRRDALGMLAALAVAPLARGQTPARPARIVILTWGRRPAESAAPSLFFYAFMHGLREAGHIEGGTLVVERHWTLGKAENRPDLEKELAALSPAVVLATGELSARAAQQAAPGIPIVLAYSGDPVAGGFAKSLARPGGDVTGMATLNEDTSPKLLESALAVVPGLARVAVLANPGVPSYPSVLKNLQGAARQAKVDLALVQARDAAQIEEGFTRLGREKLRAVVVLGDPLIFQQRQQIADLALKHGVASVYPAKEHVLAGGLLSYGVSIVAMFRQAAAFVDKILKGAKPGDLPIQQATTLELVINLKTAKALGLTVPQSLLVRADQVIE